MFLKLALMRCLLWLVLSIAGPTASLLTSSGIQNWGEPFLHVNADAMVTDTLPQDLSSTSASTATTVPSSCQTQWSHLGKEVGQPSMGWDCNPLGNRSGCDEPFSEHPFHHAHKRRSYGATKPLVNDSRSTVEAETGLDLSSPFNGSKRDGSQPDCYALSAEPSPSNSSILPSNSAEPLLSDWKSPMCSCGLLHLAVASGDISTLRLLLEVIDLPIDERDSAGYTPLQRAVASGQPHVASVLLEHGADSTVKTHPWHQRANA